jgi:hypothetical protein
VFIVNLRGVIQVIGLAVEYEAAQLLSCFYKGLVSYLHGRLFLAFGQHKYQHGREFGCERSHARPVGTQPIFKFRPTHATANNQPAHKSRRIRLAFTSSCTGVKLKVAT